MNTTPTLTRLQRAAALIASAAATYAIVIGVVSLSGSEPVPALQAMVVQASSTS